MLRRQNVTRMNVDLYSQSESEVNQPHGKGEIINRARGTCLDEPSRREASRWEDRPSSAPVAGAMTIAQSDSLARNSKARQNLQLPPFRSLGIVVPHADFLLTPPYETDIKWNASSHDPLEKRPTTPILRPTSVTSEGTTPETPQVHEFISESTSHTYTLTQTRAQNTMTEEASLDEDNVESSSWLEQAIETACKP